MIQAPIVLVDRRVTRLVGGRCSVFWILCCEYIMLYVMHFCGNMFCLSGLYLSFW